MSTTEVRSIRGGLLTAITQTLIVITGSLDEAVFDEIFRARRAGLDVLVALMGLVPDRVAVVQRARHFGVPLYEFTRERDLDLWRK